jgi:hypothetical protein
MLQMLESSSVADAHYPSTFEKLMSNLLEHIQTYRFYCFNLK